LSDGPEIIFDLKGLKEIERFLREIERHGAKVDPALKHWGAYQMQETGRTFDKGGRGPVKWPPLSEMTLAMRKARGRGANPKRMLQLTGHGKRSIQTVTLNHQGTRAQKLFTRVPYMADHQYGATRRRPEQVIVPKKKKALRFVIQTGFIRAVVFAKKVVQPARDYKIPARKFLIILPKDIEKAKELFMEHATNVAKKAARKPKPGG
jgi:phage gpG-like protein